jgi:transposase
MTFTDVARTAGITKYQAQEIIVGIVNAAAEERDLSAVTSVCIDETSKSRGHAYVTLVADTNTRAVIDVQPGRGAETVAAFCHTLEQHGGKRESITDVCVDMSPAFLKGIADQLPRANVTIDKFHVLQHAHAALDTTRRREGKDAAALKGKRWLLQKSHESLSASEHDDLYSIIRRMTSLRTARAWMYKEQLRNILSHTQPDIVEPYLRRWCAAVMRSKVEPMKDVVRMIRRHWCQIINWTNSRITNGFLESLNGVFQAAKRKARGFREFRTIRAVIFLLAGKLDFSGINPHVLPT